MKYRMLFLDIDGTLLNSKNEITHATRCAIDAIRRHGVRVVLASGRPCSGMLHFVNELNLDSGSGGYLLGFNGGKIIHAGSGETVYEHRMPQQLAERTFALASSLGLVPITYDEYGLVTPDPSQPQVQLEHTLTRLPVRKYTEGVTSLDFPMHKCLVVGEPERIAEAEIIFQSHFGNEAVIARSTPYFLEVTPQGVDKASGIRAMLQTLNLPCEQAVACGDGCNDIPMLRAAGFSVAMGNAPQEVKKHADFITARNDDDGLAAALQHIWPECFL